MSSDFRLLAATLAASLCVPFSSAAQAPETYPVGREFPVRVTTTNESAQQSPGEPTGVLRLEDALAAALLRNPELAGDGYEIRAREAALLQARAHPNPTLSVEVEDFGGSGIFNGFDAAQTTLLLGQLIELGGKRSSRIALAAADRDLASWDYEMRRIEVFVRTAGAFVDLLAAQERVRLANESVELAESLQRVAKLRLRAGIASPAEEIRAGVQSDVAGVEREHTHHELATARQAVAAMWGGEQPRFERAEGELDRLPPVPTSGDLGERLDASPSISRWRAELARRDALRERAKSGRIPDVTVRAGPRWLSLPGDTAVVVGVSLPLPLWDRGRGAVEESESRLAKLSFESHAARVRAATQLETARISLQASSEEASLLRARVIPGTERALEALRRGYESGRFAQIEVIEAERALLGAREQYLRALIEAHHSAQEIERLTGVPLEAPL